MNFHVESRGQASTEFVLVLVFVLVIIAAIILPLGQRLQFALEDVSVAGYASSGINRIESTVAAQTAVPGSSKQLMDLYIPSNTRVECSSTDNNVGFHFELNTGVFEATGDAPAGCVENPPGTIPAMSCVKYFVFPPNVDLRCQGDPLAGFVLESGQSGFTQNFRLGSTYVPGVPFTPPYVMDLNVV